MVRITVNAGGVLTHITARTITHVTAHNTIHIWHLLNKGSIFSIFFTYSSIYLKLNIYSYAILSALMSVLFLRVDEADLESTTAQISKCLHCKKSFMATFICVGWLGLKIPRDIRRKIAIECTVPTYIKLKCSIMTYYRFYATHATTQKYNPYILTFDSTGFNNAIATLIFLESKVRTRGHNFRHPFEKMLREPSIMILQTYKINNLASTFSNGMYICDFLAPRYGDVIMGIICDQLVRGYIYMQLYDDVSLIDRFEPYNNNIHAFNIDHDLGRLQNDPKRLDELYVQNPPKIYRIRHGVWTPSWMYQTCIRLITKSPPGQIALVYGFLNPDYHDKLSVESEEMTGRIIKNNGNVY